MQVVSLHEKKDIELWLRNNIDLHLYCLGDLDDFFWKHTIWYALKNEDEIKAIILLYIKTKIPTLIALAEKPADNMQVLLESVVRLFPLQLYAHLNRELITILARYYQVQSHGKYNKMALKNSSYLALVDTSEVLSLSIADLDELEQLYLESYPGNWFDKRMLETGYYYGIRLNSKLISVAGIHVYSPTYRVAALGNITTHPQFRGKGLATAVITKLCQALLLKVEHIGLNVNADNHSAIACYKKLGFEQIASYYECSLSRLFNSSSETILS